MHTSLAVAKVLLFFTLWGSNPYFCNLGNFLLLLVIQNWGHLNNSHQLTLVQAI